MPGPLRVRGIRVTADRRQNVFCQIKRERCHVISPLLILCEIDTERNNSGETLPVPKSRPACCESANDRRRAVFVLERPIREAARLRGHE